ncbi:hypothetical protein N656DRAFT_229077 [Canariomyces notabilis]|uniref:Uncharacterized protein n=1 Tax=Canariomyces notabilis TaxID=2074819 RepID=A0AAN6TLB9_9PEZI|nr:hypothetical protein N656DRAFT_229077 [Canariomyces arenarius]
MAMASRYVSLAYSTHWRRNRCVHASWQEFCYSVGSSLHGDYFSGIRTQVVGTRCGWLVEVGAFPSIDPSHSQEASVDAERPCPGSFEAVDSELFPL